MRERRARGDGIEAASHRRDIDGLRSLAIVPVLLYHAGIPGIGGGFVGVDIFFVISGFLIARLVDGEQRAGTFTLLRFYERRARRILPALLVMLLATLSAAAVLLLPNRYEDLGESALATLGFFSNIHFFQDTGYFAAEAASKPLLHTWSLAVEEQYYLLFPLLLLVCRGRLRLILLLVLATASLAMSAVMAGRHPEAAFFLPHSRFWELLLGALLGLYGDKAPADRGMREAMACLGLACILVAVVAFDDATPFPGLAALLPCAGTLLLLKAGGIAPGEQGAVSRLLASRPLVAIGLVSYSLYLWHWPLLVLAREWAGRELLTGESLAVLVFCGLLSALSWRFVEQPFRRRGSRRARPYPLSALAAALLVVLGLSLWVTISRGLPERLPAEAQAYLAAKAERPRLKTKCINKEDPEACHLGPDGAPARLLLIGDSHAAVLGEALDQVALRVGISGEALLVSGCPPVPGVVRLEVPPDLDCRSFGRRIEARMADPGLRVVVLHARWPIYVEGTRATGERGESVILQGADNFAALAQPLETLVATLTGRGLLVIIVAGVPPAGFDVPSVLALAALKGEALPLSLARAAVDARQARSWTLLRTLATRYGAILLDPRDQLCDADRCRLAEPGGSLYFDDDHLSLAGAELLVPLFAPYEDWLRSAGRP